MLSPEVIKQNSVFFMHMRKFPFDMYLSVEIYITIDFANNH